MRTLHIGLRVADLERSLAFYTRLGYQKLGDVPETAFGSLTMLKLPGDEFVSLELVHKTMASIVAYEKYRNRLPSSVDPKPMAPCKQSRGPERKRD